MKNLALISLTILVAVLAFVGCGINNDDDKRGDVLRKVSSSIESMDSIEVIVDYLNRVSTDMRIFNGFDFESKETADDKTEYSKTKEEWIDFTDKFTLVRTKNPIRKKNHEFDITTFREIYLKNYNEENDLEEYDYPEQHKQVYVAMMNAKNNGDIFSIDPTIIDGEKFSWIAVWSINLDADLSIVKPDSTLIVDSTYNRYLHR